MEEQKVRGRQKYLTLYACCYGFGGPSRISENADELPR